MLRWTELKQFCEKDGWELYKQTNRWYFRKVMTDGTVKRVKVHMEDSEINPSLLREMLVKQLQISEEYLDAVLNREKPKL